MMSAVVIAIGFIGREEKMCGLCSEIHGQLTALLHYVVKCL